jgi:hypothetical protein
MRTLAISTAVLLALATCNAKSTIPAEPADVSPPLGASTVAAPSDSTSILKLLVKDVVIGSTVDSENGDMGPRGLSLVQTNYGLKKGQVALCNFEDSSGTPGNGTTIEVFDPKPGNPVSFAQNAKIKGCSGTAVSNSNSIYATGDTSGLLVAFSRAGKLEKAYGAPFKQPFSNVDASCAHAKGFCGYSAEYMFTSDATTGAIVSFSINQNGNHKRLEVITGFDVNKKPGWSTLGPSGLAYDAKKDTLYVADGVDNIVDSFSKASELLVANEIVVKSGGTKFVCKYTSVCGAKVVYHGKPLSAPVAMTLLPNGNLIVANSAGGNTLVEVTRSGTVLDTKVVDKSKTAGVFGVLATGKSDSTTSLFYTDTNDNDLHKLEQ